MRNLCRIAFASAAAALAIAFAVPLSVNAQGAEYPITGSYNAYAPVLHKSLPPVSAAPCCGPRHALQGIWQWSIVSNLAVVPYRMPADDIPIVRTIVGPQFVAHHPIF